MRAARGRFGQAGAGAIWFRLDHPLVEGQAVSQAMRAVVAADFSNGTASTLDFRAWTYINADLTVNLSRQPVGESICSTANPGSVPTAPASRCRGSRVVNGYFGRAVQSLVIEEKRVGKRRDHWDRWNGRLPPPRKGCPGREPGGFRRQRPASSAAVDDLDLRRAGR